MAAMVDEWWWVGVVGEGVVELGGLGWWAWGVVCRSDGDPPTFPPGVWPERWPGEERLVAKPEPPGGAPA